MNNPLSNLWNIHDLLPDVQRVCDAKEVWKRAAANLEIAHERRQVQYNKGRNAVPYKVGDQDLLKTFPQSKANVGFSAKLAPRFRGPFKIVEFLNPVTVSLRDPSDGSLARAHVTHLKSFP